MSTNTGGVGVAMVALLAAGLVSGCSSSSSGSGGGGGGGLDGNCQTACNKVAAAGCGDSECLSSCEDTSAIPSACLSLAEELTSCAATSGTVSCNGDNYTIDGCETQAAAYSSCASTGGTSSSSSGGSGPSPGYGTASIVVEGDATNGYGEATVSAVTCSAGGGMNFPFPFYSGLTVFVPTSGNAQAEGDSNHVIFWGGPVTASTTSNGTQIQATLHSEAGDAPGTLTISGTYDCQ
jgi:hypothetical protein